MDTNNDLMLKLLRANNILLDGLVKLAGKSRMYNMIGQIYSAPLQVPVSKGCFAFMFTNVGDTTATVNGLTIFPSATPLTSLGDSRTIAAHQDELYMGNITLAFLPTVGAIAPNVEIVQLYYVTNSL
jgi:hypothetical protein